MTMLETFCPAYTVREVHHARIRATPAALISAVQKLDFSASFLIRALFRLRRLPVSAFDMEALSKIGIRKLAVSENEVLFGADMDRMLAPALAPASALGGDQPKRLMRIGWNFVASSDVDGQLRVTTETRVKCHHWWVVVAFLPYWVVVRPFSGLIRKEMLRLLKRRLELPR